MSVRQFDANSNIERFTLKQSTTGQGLTGLAYNTSGLIISTICDNEATPAIYTVAAGNVETIAALGTYAAPTASKCRFKEVDATNHPGLYEFQFADARYSVASSKRLVISVSGAANLLNADYEIELVAYNPFDAVRLGLTALPNAAADAAGGLPISDAGGLDLDAKLANTNEVTAARLSELDAATPGKMANDVTEILTDTGTTLDGRLPATLTANGSMKCSLVEILTTALTETAGLLAGGFKKLFNVAAPTGTLNSLPDAVPGANGGVPTTDGTKLTQTVDLTVGQIVFKKNVARANFAFPMFDSTGALKTGLSITAVIRKDNAGSFSALAGSVTEIGATGWYTVDWAQAETNADTIAFSASAAGANPTTSTILTQA